MSFNSFSSAVKLNGIKTYNGVNKATNDSFKNQFYSDIKNIDYSQYEEIDYNVFDLEKGIEKAKEKASEQPWYKTAFDYTQTIRASFTWGVLEVVENIGDGLIMAGGAIAAGVVGIFDKEAAQSIKDGTQNIVQYDWTEAGYQAEMKALGVSEEIANGMAHTIAGGAGTMAGYVALSLIPGGAAVTATAGALSAAGSAADMAFKNGATYEEALTVSAVSAVAGGISGGALNKLGVAAKGAQSIGQVAGYAAAGAAVAMTEPVINSTAEYLTYGKDMVDENGNKVYENFGDYYVDSGGLVNTIIAGGVGGISTGAQGLAGYKNNQKRYTASKSTVSEFNDSDVAALLDYAERSDYHTNWRKRDLTSWAHQNFDSVFGSEQIDALLERVTKVDDKYWPKLLEERELPETILGFVDKDGMLYLPQKANEHSAFHEFFHLVSETNGINSGNKYTDANGNLHKITGIREYYTDGFNTTMANETLTDFLASKYSDGKIYDSIYLKENVRLWSRLDDAMTTAYGQEGADLLLKSYVNNDTSAIRNFFDTYSTAGSYDDFARKLGSFELKNLDSLVSNIEKNVYKQHSSFGARIRSLFGGK